MHATSKSRIPPSTIMQEQRSTETVSKLKPSLILNPRNSTSNVTLIEAYVRSSSNETAAWLHEPEIPTSREIGHIEKGKVVDTDFEKILEPNRIEKPWDGKDHYLEAQYQLLREDGITPLRETVDEIRAYPELFEHDSDINTRIYESAFIVGIILCRRTLAVKVEFSTRRAEKKIRWPQSKRLKSGTIVALSPKNDQFRTICKVATVVSRVCSQLQVEPPAKPCIYLEWGDPREFEFDPQQEWLMVEASNGYWEAYRHTLKALQKLQSEPFPLSEHLVSLKPTIDSPKYRLDRPFMNLGPATTLKDSYECLDVFEEWPDLSVKDGKGESRSELDKTQLEAFRRILTKRLAIVQGPPGTGKTHISVVALRTLLANMKHDDPPIIVSAHTNHALDQLLRHISQFEPEFVRLGGQTLDKEVIGPRTLPQIREDMAVKPSATTKRAVRIERGILRELQDLLHPLTTDKPFSAETFRVLGLITEKQSQSLQSIEKDYVGADFNNSDDPMSVFCGNFIKPFKKPLETDFLDREFEELNDELRIEEEDMEVEFKDDKFELLHGTIISFHDGYCATMHEEHSDSLAIKVLRGYQNLAGIKADYRGSVYAYLQKRAKNVILTKVREIAVRCKNLSKEFQIGRWEQDFAILKIHGAAKIIGMTTTGLSKYRALISSLQPKIVLIEEAAETLEAYTAISCVPSIEHLILVGDHQQLRGHCNVPEFESSPWNLDVSLFERLVKNGLGYTQLQMQRRMHPKIREIISPIYPGLTDHPSVASRPEVPGLGGVKSFFFSHDFLESNDDALSKQNVREAEMIVHFYHYLIQNGLQSQEITILTFYNGQRKLITKMITQHSALKLLPRQVVTVDSYQGEENEVVLLSLTRNNIRGNIGFLSVDNRVCVALSRARRGFYLFGDSLNIYQKSQLWNKVLNVMGVDQESIMRTLPLVCKNHGKTTFVSMPSDFIGLHGGCESKCKGRLHCGHDCSLNCHPQPHDQVVCEQPCRVRLHCGHNCSNPCWYLEHECEKCIPVINYNNKDSLQPVPGERSATHTTDSKHIRSFPLINIVSDNRDMFPPLIAPSSRDNLPKRHRYKETWTSGA